MALKRVTPAIFFGEGREIAVAATGIEEVKPDAAYEVIRQSAPAVELPIQPARLLPAHCPLLARCPAC